MSTLVPARSVLDRGRDAWRSFWSGPLKLSDPALARLFGDNYRSFSGITVTPEKAFTFSAVYDAVNMISSDVAKLPLVLYKRRSGEQKGSDPFEQSKLYWLLKHEPNPEQTAFTFRQTLLAHALTCKGGYAEIERDQIGRPTALWTITPDRVEVVRKQSAGGRSELVYQLDGDSRKQLPSRDVIHIHGLGYDGTVGYDMIHLARQAIGLALAAEKFGADFFGNGTLFGGVMQTDQDLLDDTQRAGVMDRIQTYRAAQNSAFRILVTSLQEKFTQFTVKPSESQMDELRIRQVEEVARFFRLPPHKLGVNTPGTVSYASVEAANLDYLTGALLDWIIRVEQEFDRKLIAPLERRSQYVKHNVNAFLRGVAKERADALGLARDKGVISANEWRELDEMNPQPGAQGDLYLVQQAMIPADQITALVGSQIDANKAKAKPPEPPPPAPAPPAAASNDEEADRAREEAAVRIAAAEALVAEARESARLAQLALDQALAGGEARADEIAALRSALEQAQAQAPHLEAVVEFVRSRSAVLEGERDRLSSDLAARTAELSDRQAAHEALERDLAVAQEALAELRSAQAAAVDSRQALELDLAAAEARAVEVSARVEGLVSALAAAEAAGADHAGRVTELAAELVGVRADLSVAVDARDRLQADLVAQADAERRTAADLAAAQARLQELEGSLEAERSATAAAAVDRQSAEDQLAAAQARVAALEAEVAQARAETTQVRALVTSSEDAVAGRAAAVLGAHRALVVDVMRRMIDREIDRLRRAQATAEKVRAAVPTFYENHEELCAVALQPAVRAHLAYLGSSEDPHVLARRLAAQHVAESRRQLELVLEGDAEDLAGSLGSLFRRWADERTEAIADALMQKGLDHARSHER